MLAVHQSMSGKVHHPILAQNRTHHSCAACLEVESLHSLTRRGHSQNAHGLLPGALQARQVDRSFGRQTHISHGTS